MPKPAKRVELASFLRRLPWALALAVVVWLAIKPLYNQALCGTVQAVARVFEAPPAAQVVADGERAVLGRSDFRSGSARIGASLVQLHFNLVPFLALAFAVPGGPGRRGWLNLLTALAVLAVTHAIGLWIQLLYMYAFQLGAWSQAMYSAGQREAIGFARVVFELPVTFTAPFLLWIAAFHDRILPLLGLSREPEKQVPRTSSS